MYPTCHLNLQSLGRHFVSGGLCHLRGVCELQSPLAAGAASGTRPIMVSVFLPLGVSVIRSGGSTVSCFAVSWGILHTEVVFFFRKTVFALKARAFTRARWVVEI